MKQRAKLTNDTRAYIVTAYAKGTLVGEIIQTTDVTRATVYNVLKSNGIKTNRQGVKKRKRPISMQAIKRLAQWFETEHLSDSPDKESYLYHRMARLAYLYIYLKR